MPLTKNPIYRYRILDSCFANRQKRYWTVEELIAKLRTYDLTVNKRTLERDFECMRHDERLGYNAPIAYDKTEKAFYYTDPSYSISELPITTEDIDVLTVAADMLKTYKGTKLAAQFDSVVDKLIRLAGNVEAPDRQKTIIAAEDAPYSKSLDYFDAMVNAIHKKQTLIVGYRKPERDAIHSYILAPYFMKEYQGRWFVLGFCELRRRIITLALDCIGYIFILDVPFKENTLVEPEKYFRHTLGVSQGEGPVANVVLWFSPLHAHDVRVQHLHHTQKIIKDDEYGLIITLQLVPNRELLELLLRFGTRIEVLKPMSLRKQLLRELDYTRDRYLKDLNETVPKPSGITK